MLAFNPCAGDKDDGGVRLLRDQIVIARKSGRCWICADSIIPGTRIRVETAVMDGSIKSARTCHGCCDAMARSWDDDGAAIEAKIIAGLGREPTRGATA